MPIDIHAACQRCGHPRYEHRDDGTGECVSSDDPGGRICPCLEYLPVCVSVDKAADYSEPVTVEPWKP